jgi:hypothetical protein
VRYWSTRTICSAQHTIEEIATEIASVVRPDLALAATAGE